MQTNLPIKAATSLSSTSECHIILDGVFFACGYIVHIFLGNYGFFITWILLILIGRQMVKTEKFSVKKLAHSIVVSTPIGVLAAVSIQDVWGMPQSVNTMLGCLIAIIAQQILDGGWFPKVLDAVLEKIKG